MATYAIGDVHGCFATLTKLLKKMPFDPKKDRLWLVGDLVNRGPKSLEVLRWARSLSKRMGDRFQAVLGNHDLHLLAVAEGCSRSRRSDTFRKVLQAPDRPKLLRWLRRRPLAVLDGDFLLIHAGLPPSWTASKALRRGTKIQAMLARRNHRLLLLRRPWEPGVQKLGTARAVEIEKRRRDLAYLTRLRSCTRKGEPCSFSGPPEAAPKGCHPWFAVRGRRSRDVTVVCGHWAAMGLRIQEGLIALDSGCAWGNGLSAVRLEDGKTYRQKNVEKRFWP